MKYVIEPKLSEYGYCKICGDQCNGRCSTACIVDTSSYDEAN